MAHSTLDMAADARQKKAEVDAVCAELKSAGAQWTRTALFADEAMTIAGDGLRNCWMVLDRIHAAAVLDLEKAKKTGEASGA